MTEDEAGFNVTEETEVGNLEDWKETKAIVPATQGVRVRIEKPSVNVKLRDNSKPEGPENPWEYKFLNPHFRIVDGIEAPVLNDEGDPTGEVELQYKNKVVFPYKMDLIFTHNPEEKTKDWWKNRQYLGGLKSLLVALGIDLKEVKINDDFLESIKDREVLVDIENEEINMPDKDGKFIGTGKFRERTRRFNKWE